MTAAFCLVFHFSAPMEHVILVTRVEDILTRDLHREQEGRVAHPVQEVKRQDGLPAPTPPECPQSRKHFCRVLL